MSFKRKLAMLKLLPLVNQIRISGLDSLAGIDPGTIAAALDLPDSKVAKVLDAVRAVGDATGNQPATITELATQPELLALLELIASSRTDKPKSMLLMACPYCENVFAPVRELLVDPANH